MYTTRYLKYSNPVFLETLILFLTFVPLVPAYPVELSYPDDVIEGQAAIFQCSGVVDKTGSVTLAYLDDVTGEYRDVTLGDRNESVTYNDSCKTGYDVTYTLTLDMTFNNTRVRCQASSAANVSDEKIVRVIPGESVCLLYIKRFKQINSKTKQSSKQ